MPWYGLAIGGVMGSGSQAEGLGGAVAATRDDEDNDSGSAQGLFNLFGNPVWLYLGPIVGFGKNFGLYLTTGPMIGSDPDWAVGGGVHVSKFGVGVVIPLGKLLTSATAHSDKLVAAVETARQLGSGLENLVSTENGIAALAAAGISAGMAIAYKHRIHDVISRAKAAYNRASARVR